MIRVGVIGYGYWGPNIVRNFMEAPGATVVAVCDERSERLEQVNARYPSVKTTTNPPELFADPEIDAIAVVTPVTTHFDLALQALQADKHVLVEKPLASTSEQALRLIEEARHRNRVLMVDHTFVYTGAVRKIREIVASNTLGEIYYYDSVRVNLGLFQADVNVIWDLAVHDLSIMDYVLPIKPTAVSATGISHINGKPENVAYMTLFFPNRQIAHLHVNWLAPVKVRRTLIGGSEKMIVYDDLEPSEKVKVYDRGVNLFPQSEAAYELLVSYRSGDMHAPRLDATEGLRTEALHFIDCIENGNQPETDGLAGLRIVRIVEAAEKSLRNRGQLEEIATID
ncbi:MAG TPA: Gfo/Idh/MocA family oxidoreductase [Pyrinomonadaceae bacterium]|nr:Gfo/Idh/MocA family oxidoreductase [Pyrinomonadaceae bacterium]